MNNKDCMVDRFSKKHPQCSDEPGCKAGVIGCMASKSCHKVVVGCIDGPEGCPVENYMRFRWSSLRRNTQQRIVQVISKERKAFAKCHAGDENKIDSCV